MERRLDACAAAPVCVAFSGGSDSLALLRLAKVWAARAGRAVVALTVDHGLHPDSAAWTANAGRAANRMGVGWRAMAWRGPKPQSGRPAAARIARHALLAEVVRATGGCTLLMGHTADDVAESGLIREHTPTHGDLAEWAPSPAWPEGRGVFLLRPMLKLRRGDLRDWLQHDGYEWFDDPANLDPRFARTRARAVLAAAVETADPSTAAASPEDGQRGQLAQIAEANGWGGLTLDRERLLATPGAEGLLGRALVCVAGHARPPSRAALQRLMVRLHAGAPFVATLAGARLRLDGGRMHLTREPGRAGCAVVALEPHRPCVFDGRFELTTKASGLRVVALAGHAADLSKAERRVLRAAPAQVRPSLPLLLDSGGRAALPAPFGDGPATARSLSGPRLDSSLGLVGREGTHSPFQDGAP